MNDEHKMHGDTLIGGHVDQCSFEQIEGGGLLVFCHRCNYIYWRAPR